MINNKPPDEIIAAVERWIRFKAASEALKPLMRSLTKLLMNDFHPQYDELWKKSGLSGEIVNPDDLFLMSCEDGDRFYSILEERKRSLGFYNFPKDYCPQLLCDNLRIDAENDTIELVSKLEIDGFSIFAEAGMDVKERVEFMNLVLKWTSSFVNKDRIVGIELPFKCQVGSVAADIFEDINDEK